MTTSTEQDRAELPNLSLVIYWLENGCNVADAISELKIYQNQIEAARRAQVVQSVAGIQGGVIRGNPTFPKPTAPKAAPQPPEAAPVQMPEPDGYIMDSLPNGRLEYKRGPLSQMDSICNSTMPVYEYGTVRQLLAAHSTT